MENMVGQASIRIRVRRTWQVRVAVMARPGVPAQECAETPRTGGDSRRMEPVAEEHLGVSAQRWYGP